MAKLMVEGGATVSGTDYTLRDITRVATSNTKMTEVFSGSILGGASTTLDVTKVKRYLQISVRTYYNYSTFVIDTARRETVYGGSTEMAENSVNNYYTVGVCYNRTTGVFKVNNIGYFQINSTSYTSRNSNSAYCVYKIDTFDETYTDTTDYVMVPKDSTITALTSALNRIETLGQLYYPVGSIYISVNNVNPGTLFGGTWVAFGTGRTLVGVDTSQTEFNTVEKTGGEKTHTLTTNEIPRYAMTFSTTNTGNFHSDYVGTNGNVTADQIGGQAMSLLQPYITVYMWKRVV